MGARLARGKWPCVGEHPTAIPEFPIRAAGGLVGDRAGRWVRGCGRAQTAAEVRCGHAPDEVNAGSFVRRM
jgi:hypothetical protein